jgi:protein-disulfide isomerase
MEPESKSNYSVPVVIILAGIIIASAMYFSNGNKAVAPDQKNIVDQSAIVDIKNVELEGDPYIGNPNAPVTIAMWFDYQCPACKYGEINLITPLVIDYVKTGKVRIVFKDFSFLGPDSLTLSLVARAVWEAYPDKFYEWHRVIFTNQGQENTGWATKTVIDNLTKTITGIDQAVIDDLIVKNSIKYKADVDADKTEGIKFGIRATPSFIIGNQVINGVPQYNEIKLIINSLIK